MPIGTVVKLNGVDKLIMIYGYFQKDIKTNIIYDYVGTVYPHGRYDKSSDVIFNEELINEIVFLGFDTKVYREFEQKLKDKVKEII